MRRFWVLPASLGMMAFGAVALGPTVAAARGGAPKDPAKAAEIRTCLENQGVTGKPTAPPTEAEKAKIAAAKAACGIDATRMNHPAKRGGPPAGVGAAKKAQVAQCLADKGITRGKPGAGMSAEQRQAFRDALAACALPAAG